MLVGKTGVRERDVVSAVEQLLARNADPNVVNMHGYPPLHVASIFAAPRVVRALLAGKADIHQETGGSMVMPGWLPLHYAIFCGQLKRRSEAVEALLEGRADPHRRTSLPGTPAQLAWYCDQSHSALRQFGFEPAHPPEPKACAGGCGFTQWNHQHCCAACASSPGNHDQSCTREGFNFARLSYHVCSRSRLGARLLWSFGRRTLPEHYVTVPCDDL